MGNKTISSSQEPSEPGSIQEPASNIPLDNTGKPMYVPFNFWERLAGVPQGTFGDQSRIHPANRVTPTKEAGHKETPSTKADVATQTKN